MNSSTLASGDSSVSPKTSPRNVETIRSDTNESKENHKSGNSIEKDEDITTETIDSNELKLKARIAQCKNIIESLKLQLSEEKAKLMSEKRSEELVESAHHVSEYYSDATVASAQNLIGNTSMYSACVDKKLYCDETLIEYEKQLQKYQNTLNMAQNEKKNAIRKQMIAKAFKLKLMEVENQCNIELLRVKQSLQCLEPLQIIANKWKTNSDDNLFDANSYDLMPNFMELRAHSVSDVNSYKDPCHLAADNSLLSD